MSPGPPRLARRWLARLLPAADRAALLNFLDELWALRTRSDGPRRASIWYSSQLIAAPARLLAERLFPRYVYPEPLEGTHAMLDELRQAARRLTHAPGFALATILTLALGIGANTAIYSLVKGVVLDPLPYPDADELVSLWHTAPGLGIAQFEQSHATYTFYGAHARALESLGAWAEWSGALTGVEVPERLLAARVTETLLPTLGVNPSLGRPFTTADTIPGASAVILLSHGLWQRIFGADPGVIGQILTLDGTATEVVGVMPPGFAFPGPETEYWIPLQYDRSAPSVSNFSVNGIGRLRDDADLAMLNAELPDLLARLPETHSDGLVNRETIAQVGMTAYAHPYKRDVIGDIDAVLWIMVGAVGFLLLISCANVANLFLVRAESREREIAVRAALGAGRRGLLRLFLADGLVVAAAGGLAALAVAYGSIQVLVASDSVEIPRIGEVALDAGVLAFNALLAGVAGVLFAAYPLLRYRGSRLLAGLREGGRGSTGSRERLWVRHGLVVAQMAMALVLLVGAGLLARSFWHLANVDPGFEADNVLTAGIFVVDDTRYPNRTDFDSLYERLVERVGALPGVTSAASIDTIPMRSNGNRSGLWFEDFPRAEGELPDVFLYRFASPGYFETLGIPIVRGRAFEPADHQDRRPVVLLSQSVAERLWPGQNPLGKRARRGPGDEDPWLTVVGVVGDVRNGGLTTAPAEMVYYPIDGPDGDGSWYASRIGLTVRTTGDPLALVPAVRGALRELDPDLPINSVLTMERIVADTIAPISFAMGAIAIAAGVALLLGSIGIYGVISYVVGQRTREIGVRMALGARQQAVQRMVVRQGLRLCLAGAAIGLVGAAAVTRFLGSLLFGVGPFDPLAFAATTGALLAVALLAAYVPARRAARVEPAIALRSD